MLKAQLCLRTFQISGFGPSSSLDQSKYFTHSLKFPNSSQFSLQFLTHKKISKSGFISCKNHSHGKFYPKSYHNQSDDEYVEASLLITETAKHYHLRKQGFREEAKTYAGHYASNFAQVKHRRNDVNSIGLSILRRFRHPTIFLKISCEEDFLLPIVVGEFAVEKLIDSLNEGNDEDYPNSFQFIRNLVVGLENEVRMVKITERVVNTFFARIYIGKEGERENFSVDARPSDAINVAQRCKAPIYVNKQIVLADAIRISYGTGRVRDTKPIYDVLLDSPMDGPDSLVEELNLLQNMKLAAKEERYNDAAMWRDKLVQLCNSGNLNSQPKDWREASTPELP
ncbi:bifunctional nuclease 2 [Beta vulgaris subsp. vulgaris]|uniref:bifunctional nuclease 2 n=1 Tax=Beta vulgaris subsp. vulgaris TaxID=3555 RepID=UPI002036D77B|nr:bifunctional nuclease 2 [Beta vulgaris subsp. vulgaris]